MNLIDTDAKSGNFPLFVIIADNIKNIVRTVVQITKKTKYGG
ncbi:MAG: hypothetical protein WBA54_10915 [Acidaminobacteraceae bacterium]